MSHVPAVFMVWFAYGFMCFVWLSAFYRSLLVLLVVVSVAVSTYMLASLWFRYLVLSYGSRDDSVPV